MNKQMSTDTFAEMTLAFLAKHNKTKDDVLYVAVSEWNLNTGDECVTHGEVWYRSTWDEFAELANTTYEVTTYCDEPKLYETDVDIFLTLTVVGDGWWLERWHNDEMGLTGWRFKTPPAIPEDAPKMTRIRYLYSKWAHLEDDE